MGNLLGRWMSFTPPPPGTFTLSRASAQAGEFANMTCTIRNPTAIDPPLFHTKSLTSDNGSLRSSGDAHAMAESDRSLSIEVLGKRGEGALATTYDALLHREGARPSPCIFKISRPHTFPPVSKDPAETYYYSNGFNSVTARKAVLNEAEVYRYLGDKGEQGNDGLVPRYWGIGVLDPPGGRLKDADVLCVVMEDAGKRLADEEKGNPATRARIRTLYRKLHAAGVVHLDVDWRHILRDEDGRLRLIDFDQAHVRTNKTDTIWRSNTLGERHNVELRWSSEQYRNGTWLELWEGDMDESPVPFREYPPKERVKWMPKPLPPPESFA